MTYEQLLLINPSEVRKSPHLAGLFYKYYQEMYNKIPDCQGCAFTGLFMQERAKFNINEREIMSYDKTFIFKTIFIC